MSLLSILGVVWCGLAVFAFAVFWACCVISGQGES